MRVVAWLRKSDISPFSHSSPTQNLASSAAPDGAGCGALRDRERERPPPSRETLRADWARVEKLSGQGSSDKCRRAELRYVRHACWHRGLNPRQSGRVTAASGAVLWRIGKASKAKYYAADVGGLVLGLPAGALARLADDWPALCAALAQPRAAFAARRTRTQGPAAPGLPRERAQALGAVHHQRSREFIAWPPAWILLAEILIAMFVADVHEMLRRIAAIGDWVSGTVVQTESYSVRNIEHISVIQVPKNEVVQASVFDSGLFLRCDWFGLVRKYEPECLFCRNLHTLGKLAIAECRFILFGVWHQRLRDLSSETAIDDLSRRGDQHS